MKAQSEPLHILVTGGGGFIGSHIVDGYLRAGHRVTVVDNLSTGKLANVDPRARFFQSDIRDTSLHTFFQRGRFDVLNHHAAQIDLRRSVADPAHDAEVNIVGTLNLLECARRHGVQSVIFASTGGAIYGDQTIYPTPEAEAAHPQSPYGVAKLAIEHYLYYYRSVHGLRSVVLRYANVYGPRQDPFGEAGVVAIFIKRLLAGDRPIINGDGDQTRDFVFVDDVVQAAPCPFQLLEVGVMQDQIDLLGKLSIQFRDDRRDRLYDIGANELGLRQGLCGKRLDRLLDRGFRFIGLGPELFLQQRGELAHLQGCGFRCD